MKINLGQKIEPPQEARTLAGPGAAMPANPEADQTIYPTVHLADLPANHGLEIGKKFAATMHGKVLEHGINEHTGKHHVRLQIHAMEHHKGPKADTKLSGHEAMKKHFDDAEDLKDRGADEASEQS